VDSATVDADEAGEGADLVVLCTPIAQMGAMLRSVAAYLPKGAIVTDVGSVKASVVNELEKVAQQFGLIFVGSHPMAGGEKMGVSAARPDLFSNAVCVVTPSKRSPAPAVRKVSALWEEVGCRVLELSPEEHDVMVSRSSHLPHVIAGALVRTVLQDGTAPQQKLLCATGFKDTTRIASGSPEMWRDIALANSKNLNAALGAFVKELQLIRNAIAHGDSRTIEQFFTQAKALRDEWHSEVCPGASPSGPGRKRANRKSATQE